ncbi:transposable element Tc3 transposase [Trichonephila clavipes]|nr:transposable element Tc3 transposase [Trichonephila clavipes]
MFSDESRLSLQSDSRRTLIWRAPGTCYHQENTIERHRYGGAGWLVWGGIIRGSRKDLHVQSVTMIGHIYRDVILEQHVRLFQGATGAEFLFMDDNARPHRANIVDKCLQSEDITRMDWPAYSPDLNPIEQVWDMLGRRIAAHQPPPTGLPKVRRALLDEWRNIPQYQIENLILSMPRRSTGTTVSRQTVYRRLGHIGLYARRPVRCVRLTATHCRLRLTWSREHALWTLQQWSCVMFSDESRFCLQSDSHRTLIWRAPGTRYHQENTIERPRYGGAGWLVWGRNYSWFQN